MSDAIAIESAAHDLATFLLTVGEQLLLVPNVSVAEIIDYSSIESDEDNPDWLLGNFVWREQIVPLISYEALNGESLPSQFSGSRIAIFNGLENSATMPFWGMLVQTTPRQMRVIPEELQQNNDLDMGHADKMAVWVSGEAATIPDLDRIEKELLKHL